ncbi:PREDICTED: uncharacterized protein LOC107194518 [Dufourea novaeangliae]|uniref:uncharacterized protein LOC107194518 n=1 Tax=Dufourea novaeangliae TaxID=178035 RepID=UPI000767AFF3|nr:PREDICTED: uncharacterized protein LOC107194518 [Dufourea novaeangliae]
MSKLTQHTDFFQAQQNHTQKISFTTVIFVWIFLMELLEEYQELIERDATEISWLWKLVPAFFYILSAITGYICSILFYIIWHQIFHDNCPLWANSVSTLTGKSEVDNTIDEFDLNLSNADWWNHIITNYEYKNRCKIYFITCFLSCIFGTIWSTLFFMCGKGGHDVGLFEAPWRIVFPATIFNLIFAIIATYASVNLIKGYDGFMQNLNTIYLEISNNTHEIPKLMRILKIKIYQVENNVLLNKTDRDKEEEKKNTDKVKAQ